MILGIICIAPLVQDMQLKVLFNREMQIPTASNKNDNQLLLKTIQLLHYFNICGES